MSPQAPQGCEATWTGGSGFCKASGTSQTSRAQPRKGVCRAKGGQSTSGGRRPPRIYGATLGEAGAPPNVGGWVTEEWKEGGLPFRASMAEQRRREGRQHRPPPCTTMHEAGPFRATHSSTESVARWQFGLPIEREVENATGQ